MHQSPNIRYIFFTNIAIERENWLKLKKNISAKTDVNLLRTINLVIGPSLNFSERSPRGSIEEALLEIDRHLRGIERAIQYQAYQEVLFNFR